jgi:hypothetical protein
LVLVTVARLRVAEPSLPRVQIFASTDGGKPWLKHGPTVKSHPDTTSCKGNLLALSSIGLNDCKILNSAQPVGRLQVGRRSKLVTSPPKTTGGYNSSSSSRSPAGGHLRSEVAMGATCAGARYTNSRSFPCSTDEPISRSCRLCTGCRWGGFQIVPAAHLVSQKHPGFRQRMYFSMRHQRFSCLHFATLT